MFIQFRHISENIDDQSHQFVMDFEFKHGDMVFAPEILQILT